MGAKTTVPRGNRYSTTHSLILAYFTDIHQGGFTHGFVCEFQTAEDRDYYVGKDPAHMEFVGSLEGVITDARVLDYEPGKF